MAARENDIPEDEMEDQACDQTGQNSAEQEDQEPEETDKPPTASPANAESGSEENPPVDIKDVSNNGNNSNDLARRIAPAAVGLAAGTVAVVAAPFVLGAVGFTAGGVAAGSIAASVQSAVYGGSVASGSVFALLQSAGAAGIGAAGNAAIGGITAGITGGFTALGNYQRQDALAVPLAQAGPAQDAQNADGGEQPAAVAQVAVPPAQPVHEPNADVQRQDALAVPLAQAGAAQDAQNADGGEQPTAVAQVAVPPAQPVHEPNADVQLQDALAVPLPQAVPQAGAPEDAQNADGGEQLAAVAQVAVAPVQPVHELNADVNSHIIKLLICGCETEARAFAGIASSLNDTEVRVLCLDQDEAERCNTPMKELKVTFHWKGEESTCIKSQPALVTNNPEDAIRDVDIVVFLLPASSLQVFLDALKPHIKPGTIIVGLPGGPGFEFQVLHVLGDVGQQCTIMNFESSPWVCHSTEFGVSCEVLGNLLGAIKQGKDVAPKKDPVSTLKSLLGPLELPKLIIGGHLLGVQLMSVNAYLNTSIVYAQWEGWDGIPLDQPPLFYNGLTESAANLLSSVSDEVANIAKDVELKTGADMSHVVHIHLWLVRRYSNHISDNSTLHKAIQTNAAFQGIKHPVKTAEDGKFVPDFTHRYMTEDVPYGLVVIRGIAEIVGAQTPNIDKVLKWCQEKMGKEYLVNSKLQGEDVASSRAPQRYGFTSLEFIRRSIDRA